MGLKNKFLLVISIIVLFLLVVTLNTNSKLSCYSTTQTTSDTLILSLSNYTNAHIEAGNQSNYNYHVYCSDDTYTLTTDCNSKNTTIIKLSNLTNAHGELATQNNYNYSLCLGRTTKPVYCYSTQGNIPSGYEGIIKLSNYTNAHGENVSNNNYDYTIYCGDELTQIDTCINITQPGTYVLTDNLFSNSTCIGIYSSNVSLDCNDFYIQYGQLQNDSYGIYINTSLSNINISNCILNQTNSSLYYDYAIYSNGSSSNKNYNLSVSNITINTSGSYAYGLFFYYSDSNVFSSVFVNTSGYSASGLYFYYSDSNVFSSVFVNTSGDYAYGLYFRSSGFSNVSSVFVNTSGDYAYGLSFPSSDSNVFSSVFVNTSGYFARGFYFSGSYNNVSNVSVNTSGSSADGLFFYYSDSNVFSSVFVNTSGSSAYGLYFFRSESNIFFNSSVNASNSYDVYFYYSDGYPVVFFSNVSFDNSSVGFYDFDSGVLCYNSSFNGRVYVNDSNSNSLSDASVLVNSYNYASASSSKCFVFDSFTDSSGFSDVELFSFMQNQSGTFNLRDDVYFEASKVGYNYSYFVENVSDGFRVNLTLGSVSFGELFGCGVINTSGNYSLMRDVSNLSTCFKISVSNVSFDGNGYEVGYSESEKGYGFLIDSGLYNVTIGNVSIVQKNALDSSYAIFSNGSSTYKNYNLSVSNVTINTSSYQADGLHFYYSDYNTISNVFVNTSGDYARGLYFYYSDFSNFSNVSVFTFGSSGYGIYFYYSDFSNFSSVFVNTSGSSAFGLYFSGSYSSFSNVFVNTSGSSAYGLYFSHFDSTVLNDVFVSTSGSSAFGLYFSYSDFSNFSSVFVNTSGDYARGLYFYSSDSNVLNDVFINTSGSSAFGLYFSYSDSNIFYNSSINASDAYDVYFNGNYNYPTKFVNVSFNKSDVYFYDSDSGYLYTGYYVDVYVNDTFGNPLSDVSVFWNINSSVFDPNKVSLNGSSLTDNTGWSYNNIVYEYYQNYSGTFYLNNYSFNVSKGGVSNSSIENITNNTKLYYTLQGLFSCINITQPGTYVLQNNVSSDSTCFEIQSSNVVLDCNNLMILYASFSTGYGIKANSGLSNISIKNCFLNQSNSSVGASYAIYFLGDSSSKINNVSVYNISIFTSGSSSYGLYFYYSDYIKLYNFSFNSSNDYSYGFYSSHSNSLELNNITSNTSGYKAIDLYFYYSTFVDLYDAYLSSSGYYSYNIYSFYSSNLNFTNFSSLSTGRYTNTIYSYYSNYISFKNAIINSSVSSAHAFYSYYSDNLNITNLSSYTYNDYSHAFFFDNSENILFYNSSSKTNGDYSDGLRLNYVFNSFFDNLNSTTLGASSAGVHTYYSDKINFSNFYVSSFYDALVLSNYLGYSTWFLISDSVFNSSNSYDVSVYGDYYPAWFFSNVSFDNSSVGFYDFDSGVLCYNSSFSGKVYVNDTNGNPIKDASVLVNSYNYASASSRKCFVYDSFTDSSGFSDVSVYSFMQNSSGVFSLKDDVYFEASKVGYNYSYVVENVSDGFRVNLTLGSVSFGELYGCGVLNVSGNYSLMRDVSNLSTCFKITVSNVSFDGNGYEVGYSENDEGYGFYIDVNLRNITIQNTVVKEKSILGNSYGIYSKGSSSVVTYTENLTILNSSVFTFGDSSYGLYLYYSKFNNVSNVSVFTSGSYGYGIYFYSSDYNNLSDVFVNTSGSYGYGMYFYYSDYGNIKNFSSYTSNEYSYGIYFSNSDYYNLSSFFINTLERYSYGTRISSSRYINLSKETINTSEYRAYGLYLEYMYYSNISDISISTYGDSSYSLYFYRSDYNSFYNISTSTSGYSANNLYFYSSDYNNLSDVSVSTSGSSAYGLYFYGSDSNSFFNSSVNSSNSYDVYFNGDYNYPTNFTNVSFNKSDAYFYDSDSGNLSVNWYLKVKVLNATNGNPLGFANVTVNNSNGVIVLNETSNSNGVLDWTVLKEYYQLYSGFNNDTPLNVSAEYNGLSNYKIISFQNNTEVTILIPRDENAPYWDSNVTNETSVNPKKFEFIMLNVSLFDDVSLYSFVFSWNDSGVWVNDSPVFIDGSSFVVNVSKNVTSSKGSVVGWKVYFNDSSNNTNETDIFTFKVKNTLPSVPVLSYPEDNDSFFINRTPRFNWSQSYDLDGDSITYIWQLSLTKDFSTIIAEDNALATNYKDYGILDFNTYYWHVAACDDEGCSSNSSIFNFTVVPFVNISLQNNNIDFGNINLGEQNDTTDNIPLPITVKNTGNVKVNISINATALWSSVSLDSDYYQYKARVKDLNAFNTTLSQITFNNLSTTKKLAIAYLNWTDNTSAYIDILVKAPNLGSDEPPGQKTSNLTIIADQS